MKNKLKALFHLLLFITYFIGSSNQINGKEKINLAGGFGFPEVFNIGVRYQLEQAQIGVNIGSSLFDRDITFSGDGYYHFGGYSELSSRKPWYLKGGYTYWRSETTNKIDKMGLLNLRIGRDINISQKVGINLEGGAFYVLFDEEIVKIPSESWLGSIHWLDFQGIIGASFGLAVFYRF